MKGLTVILVGCLLTAMAMRNADLPSSSGHVPEIELRELFTIGSQAGEDGVFFGNIGSLVAVDDAGRIFIGEKQSPKIQAFTAKGDLINEIGREGEAPGEFRSLGAIHAGPGDTLYAFDPTLRRISAFAPNTLDLAYAFTVSGNATGSYPSDFFGAIDRGFLVVFEEPGSDSPRSLDANIVGWAGDVIQGPFMRLPAVEWVILKGPYRPMATHMPFGRYSFFRLGPADQIYAGSSSSIEVTIVAADGTSRGSITHPLDGTPVTRSDIDEYVIDYSADIARQVQRAMRYKTWPVYSTFIVDNRGRIWVRLSSADKDADTSRWLVLDTESQEVGELILPSSISIQVVVDGRAYATADGFSLVVFEISES